MLRFLLKVVLFYGTLDHSTGLFIYCRMESSCLGARDWTYSSYSGILSTLLGFAQAGDAISKAGDVSMDLIASGIKIALIPTIYGGLIYLVSLIMRIILKPRI